MIPIRDSTRSRRFPIINFLLIIANFLVFAYELSLGREELAVFFHQFGLIPADLVKWVGLAGDRGTATLPADPAMVLASLFTAMFIHGGWFHIVGNMLYLWVFGDNIEDRLGSLGYLAFYLLAGVAASLSHVVANPASTIPIIGASGAVAGVLGAYLVHFPRARVLALVPLGLFLQLIEVPAVLFLVLWFVLQLASGVAGLGVASQASEGVAWWAHVGGFVFGVLLILYLRLPRRSGSGAGRERW